MTEGPICAHCCRPMAACLCSQRRDATRGYRAHLAKVLGLEGEPTRAAIDREIGELIELETEVLRAIAIYGVRGDLEELRNRIIDLGVDREGR